jgi:uncharacterized protein HemX
MSDPAPAPDLINDQVQAAVHQAARLMDEAGRPFAQAAVGQAIVQALGLAAHNVVAQQQHAYMLRTALTTAAARALLDGRREEAEAVLKLAESRLVTPDVSEELGRLLSTLHATLDEMSKPGVVSSSSA